MFNILKKKKNSLRMNFESLQKGTKYEVLMSEKAAQTIESLDISPKDAKTIRELYDVLYSDNVAEGLKKYTVENDDEGGFTISLCDGLFLHIYVWNKYIRIDTVTYDELKFHVVEKATDMHSLKKEMRKTTDTNNDKNFHVIEKTEDKHSLKEEIRKLDDLIKSCNYLAESLQKTKNEIETLATLDSIDVSKIYEKGTSNFEIDERVLESMISISAMLNNDLGHLDDSLDTEMNHDISASIASLVDNDSTAISKKKHSLFEKTVEQT